jgi:GTP cyclohydrolase I
VTEQHEAVKTLLRGIGIDPDQEELRETPARYLRALREMTAGYRLDPAAILAKTFPAERAGLVTCHGIRFAALCQHHMLPFTGTATITYLPADRIVGLSKLARLVDCFARRLTLQERLTGQVADAMHEYLEPQGVIVRVVARHGCVECRGVRQWGMRVTTEARRGCYA